MTTLYETVNNYGPTVFKHVRTCTNTIIDIKQWCTIVIQVEKFVIQVEKLTEVDRS